MSEFRRRVRIRIVEPVLEPQNVAGRLLAFCHRIDAGAATDQTGQFQLAEMVVQGRAADLAIGCQPRLGREATEIGVVTVAEMPEHDLGGRLQPALQDRPVGRKMAHAQVLRDVEALALAQALRRGFCAWTRVVMP